MARRMVRSVASTWRCMASRALDAEWASNARTMATCSPCDSGRRAGAAWMMSRPVASPIQISRTALKTNSFFDAAAISSWNSTSTARRRGRDSSSFSSIRSWRSLAMSGSVICSAARAAASGSTAARYSKSWRRCSALPRSRSSVSSVAGALTNAPP